MASFEKSSTDRVGSPDSGAAPGVPERLTRYLMLLLVFLALVGFFDTFATSFRYTMITYVRKDFGLSFSSMVNLFTWVYLGSCLSFIPRVLADVYGRRIMLCVTMAALCLFQWLIGFARTPFEYGMLLTLLAVFYKSDIWMLVMSEEAPPRQRGLFSAVTVAMGVCGALVLGELVRRMGPAADAWREIARFPIWGLFASIPLFFFVRETQHFRHRKSVNPKGAGLRLLMAPFRRQYLKPLVVLSVMKMLLPAGAIVTMALLGTEYLRVDNGFGPEIVGRIVQGEILAGMGSWLVVGCLSDRIGRHSCLYLFGAFYVISLLCLALLPKGSTGVIIAFISQIFGATGVYAILRLATMELLPNDCRATGSAWTDLFMTLFAVLTTRTLGFITQPTARGEHWVSLSTCIIVVALGVLCVLPLFRFLRETRGQKLEEV